MARGRCRKHWGTQRLYVGLGASQVAALVDSIVINWLFGIRCQARFSGPRRVPCTYPNWVAVKELNLSCYVGENVLFTRYTHSDNLV